MSIFAALQRALPQHGLSRLAGRVANSSTPWFKDLFIKSFMRAYEIDLQEAVISDPSEFGSFNDFFTRALKPDARPISEDPLTICCPADGAISQAGAITNDTLLQAKGARYDLRSLALGLGSGFDGGSFFTVYLAPHNYHRVHLPFAGQLEATVAVPGELFSVNNATENAIEGLFVRNERLVCRFQTTFGPMLVVFVGAMIVGSIATVWHETPTPYRSIIETDLKDRDLTYEKGDEIGRFLLGSTVICCFPDSVVALDESLAPGTPLQMGQAMGLVNA